MKRHLPLLIAVGLLLLLGLTVPTMLQQSAGLKALQEGEAHFAKGSFTAAEQAYQKALQLLPQDPQPAKQLAALYQAWRYPEKGLSTLEEAQARGATAESLLTLRLALLAESGAWDEAAAAARDSLQATPQSPEALSTLTEALLQQGNCTEAQFAAARWRAAAPKDPAALRAWGVLALEEEREEAVQALCQADSGLCQALQTGAPATLSLGQALIRQRQWALAACTLERAAATAPASAEAHAWLGAALDALDRDAEALPHLQQATDLAPDLSVGWLLLGTHYLNSGQLELSHQALLQAQQCDPGNPVIHLTIAAALAAEGQYDNIGQWTESALQQAPEDPDVWKTVARFYLERNLQQGDQPLKSAGRAVALAPEDPEAQLLLGWALLMGGDAQNALTPLEVVTAGPLAASGEAWHLHGMALRALGREAEALDAFTRAADLGYR